MHSVSINRILRQWYPGCVVVKTPKETGLHKLAKAGHAKMTLDTSSEFHVSRIYSRDYDEPRENGRLKDIPELAIYNYTWKARNFTVYAVKFNYGEYESENNHFIIYPETQAMIVDGRLTVIDELITASAKFSDEIEDAIWVYDKGYWHKSRKLWKNVQECTWEDVILNNELKAQLATDIEGFFDRQKDYESFAVPWKVGNLCLLLQYTLLCVRSSQTLLWFLAMAVYLLVLLSLSLGANTALLSWVSNARIDQTNDLCSEVLFSMGFPEMARQSP